MLVKIKESAEEKYNVIIKLFSVIVVCILLVFLMGLNTGSHIIASDQAVEQDLATESESADIQELVIDNVKKSETVENVEVETATVQPLYNVSAEEYEMLVRLVEAEAGGEDETGKLLVTNVILNRVKDERFPNTVTEVIHSPGQFSPIGWRGFNNIVASDNTRACVDRALVGEDYSQGAIYFAANAVSGVMSGHTFLFQYGGHSFYL